MPVYACVITNIHTYMGTYIHFVHSLPSILFVLSRTFRVKAFTNIVQRCSKGVYVCMYICLYVCICITNIVRRCSKGVYVCIYACMYVYVLQTLCGDAARVCMYVSSLCAQFVCLHACMYEAFYNSVRR